MSTNRLLARLRGLDITLWTEGEKLKYSAPKGVMTDELLSELTGNKKDLIDWLNRVTPDNGKTDPGIKPVPMERDFPTSFSQERLLFLQQLVPNTSSYNLPLAVRLVGAIDIEALQQSLNEIVSRHESLRTRFTTRNGQHRQVVDPQQSINMDVVIVSDKDEVPVLVEEEKFLPFDLVNGPLIRCKLFIISEQEHILILTLHHITCDGWSLGILFDELNTLYTAYRENRSVHLPKLSIRYADFASWQRETLTGELLREHLDFWLGNLKDLPEIQLPLDHVRPRVPNFEGGFIVQQLPPGLVGSLTSLGESEEATQFMTFFTVFAVLMHRYCGQDDIVLGTPVANRNRTELEGIVGFFVNMLVLRTDVSGGSSFRELLAKVKKVVLNAYQHQQLPFEKLVNELRTERDAGRNPLFQVAFALQQATLSPVKLKGLSIEPVQQLDRGASRFDLEFNLFETENGLDIKCCYRKDLFEAPTIERMLQHYQQLLESIASNPDQSIDTVQMLLPQERHLLLQEWNNTTTAYPRERTLQELFEYQVATSPDSIAVEFGDNTLSYAQLNTRANQLAHYLRANGIGPEVLVGLYLERGPEMIVGLLGILKAGGAYLPLDLDYPQSRLAFMLEDARVPLILSMTSICASFPDFAGKTICLDSDWTTIAEQNGDNPVPSATADNLAYVIYTSGSTGTPKGVEIPQRAINRLVCGADYYQVDASDRIAQASNISFDAATFEIWGALLNGARLVGLPKDILLNSKALAAFLREQKISAMFLTTAVFNQISREAADAFSGLKGLLFGGEAVDPEAVHRVITSQPPQRLLHVYGPTESTTFASWYPVEDVALDAGTVPIGRPVSNTTTFVLDQQMQPVPVGVHGELYIGGDGLARGYLNQPELTAEKFVANPFSDKVGERLYRTGDEVRYRRDAAIEFIGRFDQQVKIRGFRIELGEIEAALTRHEKLREAVVIMREDQPGDKRLVAYLVAEQSDVPAAAELREFLRQQLPNYMMPAAFEVLDSLPLTPNGKLDRDALPSPGVEYVASENFLAPSGELETRIAAIWSDLLGLQKLGTHDNFFDLGGHSLLISQVQARINAELDYKISMLDLFQYPTINSLARHIGGQSKLILATQKAKVRIDKRKRDASRGDDEALAIIGMAGRFPGAATLEDYWDNLVNGVESIRFFSDEELAAAGIADELIGDPRFVPAKGYLDDADLFDAAFFGYPPREAEQIDPQQRIFLECSWEALERAGYDPQRYPGLIAVYAGSSTNGYSNNLYSHPEIMSTSGALQVFINSDKGFLPTRISYKLNLRGPSVNVQSACSTSLLAIHEACKSLRERECDIALAGGISVMTPRISGYIYQDESILSPDGHCKAFSADARGTVSGEGAGVVVLKRLAEAQQDGDLIQAVICGTAINNDGSNKVGYTAPSVEGQADVIALAQAAAQVSAESIDYVETHGTGTALGDPIEIAALTRVFGESKNDSGRQCAIGAVKTNIGHLDAAAGVAGVIKTVLALKHKQIPPSLNFTEPNPEIDFEFSPFYVNTALKPWESRGDSPRRAGVSAFGIGGTNAHVVLQQAPSPEISEPGRAWQVLPVSAKCEAALEISTNRIGNYLQQNPAASLADVSYTLRTGRGQFEYRAAAIASDNETAITILRGEKTGRWWTNSDVTSSPPVIFMFPGQGSQYPGMGQGLYETEAVFRDIVDYCCTQLKSHINCDLRDLLFPPPQHETKQIDEQLRQTLMAQCSLFVIEYALAKLWLSWGIQPVAMIGHSIGEYVAACISGVIDLDETLLLIARRGQAMEQAPAGAMLSIPLAENLVTPYLRDDLWLSVINGHSNCVVSGSPAAIEQLEQDLKTDGVDALRLHTAGAFHSGLMDEVVPQLVEAASQLSTSPPAIPYISNVTGTWIEAAQLEQPEYWGQHLRSTVLFAQGVDELLGKFEQGIFLETGPGNNLGSMVRRCASDNRTSAEVLSSLPHPRESLADGEAVARALAGLWIRGVDIDWQQYDQHSRRCRIELPTYPFQRQSYWVELAGKPVTSGIATVRQALKNWFYVPQWKSSMPLKPREKAGIDGQWLVLCDDAGISDKIRQWLQQARVEAICVNAGNGFSLHDNGDYTIEPGNADDYRLLVESLRQISKLPQHVIHLWSVTPDTRHEKSSGFAFDPLVMCYHSLIYLAQSLGVSGGSDTVDISVISNATHAVLKDDPLCPEKATLLGPCAVIGQEYPNLSCRNIDIDISQQDVEVESLMAEVLNPTDEMVVAYRHGQRWLKYYEPVTLDAADQEALPIKADGVYLITGGLGGIGLAVADYLAREYQARLVLTGRSELPPREEWPGLLASENSGANTILKDIRSVHALEQQGARVLVLQADVADKDEMREVLNRTRQEFGEINGVIHSAGVPGGRIIQLQTAETANAVMAPKVGGTRVLGELLEPLELDFMVFCSSLAPVLGVAGQVDYCSANAFQDACAQYYSAKSGMPVISINWDTWNESGMAIDTMQEMGRDKSELIGMGFNNNEGVEVFQRILAGSTVPQLAVSTYELPLRMPHRVTDIHAEPDAALERESLATSSTATAKLYERPQLKTPYVEPSAKLEIAICKMWQELLGIERAGIDDNFFELGGHSLLATQLIARLRTELALELSLENIFEAPTVGQLAAFVDGQQAMAEPVEEVARLAQQIKQMTPEQHRQMLAQARGGKA